MSFTTYSTQGNLALTVSVPNKPTFEVIDGTASAQKTYDRVAQPLIVEPSHSDVVATVSSIAPSVAHSPVQRFASRVMASICIAAFVAAFIFVGFSALSSQSRSIDLQTVTSTQTVSVRPGDSLWSIADTYALPGYSTQELADAIYDLNGLTQSMLTPGMQLLVPTSVQ